MQNKIIAAFALLVIIAANAMVWFTRPSAEPAYPDDVFPPELAHTPDTPEPGKPQPTATKPPVAPTTPLQLNLEPVVPVIPEIPGPLPPPLEQSPHLSIHATPKGAVPPQLPGTRLNTAHPGKRLSEKLKLKAGVDAAYDDHFDRREPAVGLRLQLSFE